MKISTEYGVVEFGVKNDLNEEEGAAYLPGYYQNCVVELSFIKSNGNMGGHQLMKAFLNHEIVQSGGNNRLDLLRTNSPRVSLPPRTPHKR